MPRKLPSLVQSQELVLPLAAMKRPEIKEPERPSHPAEGLVLCREEPRRHPNDVRSHLLLSQERRGTAVLTSLGLCLFLQGQPSPGRVLCREEIRLRPKEKNCLLLSPEKQGIAVPTSLGLCLFQQCLLSKGRVPGPRKQASSPRRPWRSMKFLRRNRRLDRTLARKGNRFRRNRRLRK